ncbi:MAG: hypothetical protein JSW60_09100, partial [Thermoplasmatales archaeon]
IDFDCYGFVIPIPSGDSTYETFVNSKVRHMINDMLRENITIYWSSRNFSELSKDMDKNSIIYDNFYEKGAFIVPFSGDIYKDVMATAIIYDYNETSEIENWFPKVGVYKLMDPLNIWGYKLSEPKIAQHLGLYTRYGWPCYLQIAEAGGFLTFEFLLDNETAKDLNNKDFNVLMWPYGPAQGKLFEKMKTLLNFKGYYAIREFVRSGGGYIGSCYGAYVASSGFVGPFSLFSLRRHYYPNLSILPFFSLSISDNLMQYFYDKDNLYITTVEMVNTNHPLSFGINKSVELFNGGWFKWLGKHSHKVGIYQNITYSNGDYNISSYLKKSLIGTPGWITSTFGKGKSVQYSGHPEFVNNISILFEKLDWDGDKYYGRRTIHNALFYVTSGALENYITNVHYPVSFIEEIGEKTINLSIDPSNHSEFDEIKIRINNLNTNLSHLKNISSALIKLFSEYDYQSTSYDEETTPITPSVLHPATYTFHFCNIFSDFNNKTLSELNKLEQLYQMLEFNDSVTQLIHDLKLDISRRLNHSQKLISDVIIMANYIKDLLQNRGPIVFSKLIAIRKARHMIATFEIGLKYIPQTYFETLKLVRHLWYNYEANVALAFSKL